MPHRPVSAAEKYAELEALGQERPRCDCHDKAMTWSTTPALRAGGRWKCKVKAREAQRGWTMLNREKAAAIDRRWKKNNQEKVQATRRARYWSDPEKARAVGVAWGKANPEKVRAKNARRVRMFGASIYMPDQAFADFARRVRDERKAALKEAS